MKRISMPKYDRYRADDSLIIEAAVDNYRLEHPNASAAALDYVRTIAMATLKTIESEVR